MSEELFPCVILHEGYAAGDGVSLARPLSVKDAAAMGADSGISYAAPLFVAGEATSTLDLGWSLAETRRLPPWSAVIAMAQTGGRGQMRREWHSPPGNLYVSFFLPEGLARLENLASLCLGWLVHTVLKDFDIKTALKWPNDLLLVIRDGVGEKEGKFGGLLLEERRGRILAGLGLNMRHAPDPALLREGHAVAAAALPLFDGTVCGFWADFLAGLIRYYERDIARASPETVRLLVEDSLAWRGLTVYADEAGRAGRMAGITREGALRLETQNGCLLIDSGSIRRV